MRSLAVRQFRLQFDSCRVLRSLTLDEKCRHIQTFEEGISEIRSNSLSAPFYSEILSIDRSASSPLMRFNSTLTKETNITFVDPF